MRNLPREINILPFNIPFRDYEHEVGFQRPSISQRLYKRLHRVCAPTPVLLPQGRTGNASFHIDSPSASSPWQRERPPPMQSAAPGHSSTTPENLVRPTRLLPVHPPSTHRRGRPAFRATMIAVSLRYPTTLGGTPFLDGFIRVEVGSGYAKRRLVWRRSR